MSVIARYAFEGEKHYGLVDGETIRELRGGLFEAPLLTGREVALSRVKLLAPCQPPKILAVGLNYRSHLGSRPVPQIPGIFYKPVSSIQNPGDPIVIPEEATDVHYEGELVVVIGKKISKASREEAAAAIFGVTCGNDVSERSWQRGDAKDLQWWRAKGCDTFSPFGPYIVTGTIYGDLALQTRLNGEVVQAQRTSDLIFDIPEVVRFISQWVTLAPGDLIYTGTPGETRRMKPGDVVEVEIEGVGTLRNPVA
ncbi:MAG TPA: fumarylacetoacetate hydrolase family protein [Bryobacteraceae bacterium]|nr:fumarylacetoacetate hydrolase family protein [Bryobacteraceae bacterium]